MSAFSPEILAQALIPKDLLGHASSLHFSVHIGNQVIKTALSEAAGGDFHWSRSFLIESSSPDGGDMMRFIAERNWNDKVFRKCTISFDVMRFCLVPMAFFNPDNARELLEFNCGEIGQEVDYVEVREADAMLIYESPSWRKELMKGFPNGRIFPSAFLFLKHAKGIAPKDADSVFIYDADSMMMLVIFKAGRLVLLNSYPAKNEEDVLYHASNAAMALNVDFENAFLNVYSFKDDLNLLNFLKQYNRNSRQLISEEGSNSGNTSFISHLHILCA